ncbi:MAG: hypothetical protein WBP94_05205, partial [Rhodomicrobiaceae bacterium]
IKARGIMKNRPTPTYSKLTTSVLLTSDCAHCEEAANWRDSLAAITYRNLARQICDQFYDLSLFYAWRNRTLEAVSAGRMLSPALPSYCKDRTAASAGNLRSQPSDKARILEAVLPPFAERRGAVLISLRSKAA